MVGGCVKKMVVCNHLKKRKNYSSGSLNVEYYVSGTLGLNLLYRKPYTI